MAQPRRNFDTNFFSFMWITDITAQETNMLHTHIHKHSDCKHCILSAERHQEIFVYNLGSPKHWLLTLSGVLIEQWYFLRGLVGRIGGRSGVVKSACHIRSGPRFESQLEDLCCMSHPSSLPFLSYPLSNKGVYAWKKIFEEKKKKNYRTDCL